MGKRKSMTETVLDAIHRCGLTRAEIARRSGLSEGALSRFVHGQRDFKLSTIDKLADVVGLRIVFDKPKARTKAAKRKRKG